jgi:V8-like Glu-specific endopeptidase
MFKTLLLIFLFFSNTLFATTSKVIYGDDNRENPADSSALLRELSRSTAAMVSPVYLHQTGDNINISATTLEGRGICPTERFANQITAAVCSGFLVAPDLLVTAGHCIKRKSDCQKYQWVFDYVDNSNGQRIITIPTSSVYSCKKILSRSQSRRTQNDFALIRLDRKVTDRSPLKVRTSGKVANNTPLTVIGHPTGLPTKIASGANIRANNNKYFFIANLDTFGGNSGSVVLDSVTRLVEGILVRGERDYVSQGGCQIPNHCDMNSCRGEDVTRITNIKKLMRILRRQ